MYHYAEFMLIMQYACTLPAYNVISAVPHSLYLMWVLRLTRKLSCQVTRRDTDNSHLFARVVVVARGCNGQCFHPMGDALKRDEQAVAVYSAYIYLATLT